MVLYLWVILQSVFLVMIFIQTWWYYFVLISGIPEPNVTIQSRIYEMSLKLTHTVQGCYRDVSYSITLTFNNGSFNYNRLHNTTAQEYTITELEPSTNYSVIVIAFSREDPDIHSNSVAVETATLGM